MYILLYYVMKTLKYKISQDAIKLVCGRADTDQYKYFDSQTAKIEIPLYTLSVKRKFLSL